MDLTTRVIKGFGWTASGRFLGQLVAWAVSLVVIRFLDPGDYGLLAMASVLTGFVGLFSELGLGWAVVNARDVSNNTLRSVFGLIVLVNGALYLVLYLSAPLVASFFSEHRLIELIDVMGFQLLLAAPGVIPDAMLQRELEFKRRSMVNLSATVAAGAVTFVLAAAGFGVWALIYGTLVAAAWRTIGINVIRPFVSVPSFAFSGLARLFSFGGHVAISRALLYAYLQADMVIAGRFFGKEQVGFYSVAMHLASLPMQRVSAILNEVAFPVFARLQDEHDSVRIYTLRSIGVLSLFGFPIFWGLLAIAPEIAAVVLGPKWQPVILPLQLLALVMPLRMVGQLMSPTLQGIGEARLAASNQFFAFAVLVVAFLVGANYGIVGLSAAWVIGYPVILLVYLPSWLSRVHVTVAQFFGAMARPASAAAGMLLLVTAARAAFPMEGATSLFFLTAIGMAAYIALTLLINRAAIREVIVAFRRMRSPSLTVSHMSAKD